MADRNLYRRGKGKIWWGRVEIATVVHRQSLRTASKEEARARLETWKGNLEREAYLGAKRMLWSEAVLRYATEVMAGNLKQSTQERYLVSFRQMRELDPLYLDQIGRREVAKLIGSRKRVASNKTIHRDLTAMSRVFASAISWEACEHNPALEYDRSLVRQRSDPIELPSTEEVNAAIAAPSTFWRIIAFASQTGMRQSEILALTWREVELNARLITIGQSKTDRARMIPLDDGPLLQQAAVTLAVTPRHPVVPLVFWHGEGQPYRNFSSQFREWRRRRKVAFRFHDLRHWFAVMYLRQGGGLYDLQRILGHASIKTTEGYLDYMTPAQANRARAVRSQIRSQV